MLNELSLLDSILSDVCGSGYDSAMGFYTPSVDVMENDAAYTLAMDLPGRTDKDITIEIDRNVLTIASKKAETKAEKKTEKSEEKEAEKSVEKYILRERKTSNFSRKFTLPEDVNTQEITASFKDGVLIISMAKKALEAPKKILINAA